MANKNEISTTLKRTLRSGKEYDKLIPTVSCERTPLGEGDTFFSVDSMKDWIEKYSFQTAKLAPRLSGHTLEATVDNIYRFLYQHVQYTADGALQQLRSPACTWAQRREGVDCKSYSVFASSILSNLGIKHLIRQIRQPYFHPDQWTHVYVVVPKDQNSKNIKENAPTLVLDATKHQNTESNYIEKADLEMTKLAHVGLNAPQDNRTRQIVENFESFCKVLLFKGVPVATVNTIREEVSKYTSRGQDPKFNIINQGIVIEGQFFPLNTKSIGLMADSGGSGSDTAAYVEAGKKLVDMIPEGFFENTFGQLFSDGCWNSGNTPSKSKGEAAIDGPDFYKRANLESEVSAANINKFVEMAEIYIAARAFGVNNDELDDCTREGNKMGKELMQAFLDKTLAEIRSRLNKQGHKLVVAEKITPIAGNIKINSTYHNGSISTTRYGVRVNAYEIQKGAGNITGNITTGGGSNTGLIIGGVALAAMPFLLPMIKNKPKVPSKLKSKKPASI